MRKTGAGVPNPKLFPFKGLSFTLEGNTNTDTDTNTNTYTNTNTNTNTTVNDLAIESTKATKPTRNKITTLLFYLATNPNVALACRKSDMMLKHTL